MICRLLRFAALFALVAIFTECSKDNAKETTGAALTGNWEWISTDGGIAAHIHDTPASTGKTIELKFDAGNKYFIYTNGALTSEGTYTLETRKCIHDQTDKTFINFSSDADMMVEKNDQLNLELSDEAADGVVSLYKIKQTTSLTTGYVIRRSGLVWSQEFGVRGRYSH